MIYLSMDYSQIIYVVYVFLGLGDNPKLIKMFDVEEAPTGLMSLT